MTDTTLKAVNAVRRFYIWGDFEEDETGEWVRYDDFIQGCAAARAAAEAERDDLVQAAVAAALREAVSAVKQSADDDDISLGAAQWVIDDILDLITPDAQAALDRVVAARFGTVR